MSRLNETSEGWQWDDGPIFPERVRAIEYGQFMMCKEIEKELEHLQEVRQTLLLHLELLEKEAEKRQDKT